MEQCVRKAIFFNRSYVKTWLLSTMAQQGFTSVSILNSQKVKTDNSDLLATDAAISAASQETICRHENYEEFHV